MTASNKVHISKNSFFIHIFRISRSLSNMHLRFIIITNKLLKAHLTLNKKRVRLHKILFLPKICVISEYIFISSMPPPFCPKNTCMPNLSYLTLTFQLREKKQGSAYFNVWSKTSRYNKNSLLFPSPPPLDKKYHTFLW